LAVPIASLLLLPKIKIIIHDNRSAERCKGQNNGFEEVSLTTIPRLKKLRKKKL